jgi:hypothetical protein
MTTIAEHIGATPEVTNDLFASALKFVLFDGTSTTPTQSEAQIQAITNTLLQMQSPTDSEQTIIPLNFE